ncbi:amino acid ABC transporter substrate-binding protein [Candidatus Methylospira mobilis]|uniref:Amino acid ABC transporter substrate-binding protein n=1 Tax=Candidatus Methylospira mobilis TaxID=1808979 RepID=A0A5Q0BQW3_9GAMM|nr:hypothetical protein [Candidatus Methylospira mobilis]QFY44584.1 amino acid ABC transporter substrate-binding protein [Candidatus Methylospira mobilis]WNV05978.1 hypothetical protein RP726_06070 [Candidatus Methylospira mobilis]
MPSPLEFIAVKEVIKVPLANMLPTLNALAVGLNLVLGDKRDINLLAKFMPNEAKALEFLPQCFLKIDLFAGISKTNPDHAKFVQDFNLALARMKRDGSYQTIMDKHISDY